MELVILNVLLVGFVVVGADDEIREITADSKKEINRRSVIALDNALLSWKPSISQVFKRRDDSALEAESVSSVYGRDPRSLLPHLTPASTHRPPQHHPKHKLSVGHNLKSKTQHSRQKSHHAKPALTNSERLAHANALKKSLELKRKNTLKKAQTDVFIKADPSKRRKFHSRTTKHKKVAKLHVGHKGPKIKHLLDTKKRKQLPKHGRP